MSIIINLLATLLVIWFIKETVSFLLHCTLLGRLVLKTSKSIFKISKHLVISARADYKKVKKHYSPKQVPVITPVSTVVTYTVVNGGKAVKKIG